MLVELSDVGVVGASGRVVAESLLQLLLLLAILGAAVLEPHLGRH